MWKKRETILAAVFLLAIAILGGMTLIRSYQKIGYRMLFGYQQYLPEQPGFFNHIEGIFRQAESALTDNLFMRKPLAALDTNVKFFMTGRLVSTQVLLGRENWLFYKTENDGSPLVDYEGTHPYSGIMVETIRDNLVAIEQYLTEKGIRFVLMIPPNKEQVMEQFMPDGLEKKSDCSRTDRLISYLRQETDLVIVDPKEELISLSLEYPLYFRYDSHWNQLGSYIAEQQLLAQLGKETLPLAAQDLVSGDELDVRGLLNPSILDQKKDLAEMTGMAWYFNGDNNWFVKNSKYDIAEHKKKNRNRSAKHQETVLIIGDSFKESLLPHLFMDFKRVYAVDRVNVDENSNQYLFDAVDGTHPDVLLLECVERYTGYLEYLTIPDQNK